MTSKSSVMKLANSLHYRKGLTRSQALKTAWGMVKQVEFHLKAVGVTFGLRQTALMRLQHYAPDQITVSLVRENNLHDPNAVGIIATVAGKGSFRIGYLPRGTAQILAPLIEAQRVSGELEHITGGHGKSLGANLKLRLIA